MKLLILAVPLLIMSATMLPAQTAATTSAAVPAATTAPVAGTSAAAAPAADGDGDRYSALRAVADRLKGIYEQADTDNMADVEKLLRTRRCQIARVGGLLDRTRDAMNQWIEAEKAYWKAWSESEQTRVDNQMKTLAGMEQDQTRISDLLDVEKKGREELQRRKSLLEKGKRTEEIAAEIDGLIKDIQDSEARLTEAQQQYDSLTVQINNMRASISARVVNMRQQTARVEAYQLDMGAFYEKNRQAAQEICNTKQPDTQKTALPKRGSNQ